MPTARPIATRLGFLLVLMPVVLAVGCPTFKGIAILEPVPGELRADDNVRLEARFAKAIDLSTTVVMLDGVDLVQQFGLVPPFTGQGGNVMIGPDLVVVSDFGLDPDGPYPHLRLDAGGLSVGAHDFDVQGFRPSDGATVIATKGFVMVGALDEKVRAITSAGLVAPSKTSGGFHLGNASAGDASAGMPVSYPDGSELRTGVIETVEARLAGGTP
ncbi:MAG: hypothetical protein GY723_10745 [bacterium]|nr:hypothetical protein [bacterium]MCP5067432.1 hypothetical protein [bacterium]